MVYKHKAYLDLCLSLIESACNDLDQGHYDLAREQLVDILETFNDEAPLPNNGRYRNNVMPFSIK